MSRTVTLLLLVIVVALSYFVYFNPGSVTLTLWMDKTQNFPVIGVVGVSLVLGALLVLGPVVMPWYVTWLLPLAILARERVWLVFSALVCLAFLVMVDGVERPGALWIEYAALGGLLLWRARKGRPSSIAGEFRRRGLR